MITWENNEEIQIFREYLKIPSVHPDIDYEPCVAFLKRQADNLNLPYAIYTPSENAKKPIFVITWPGIEPSLPSILLNSHMDVVPVFEDKWTHPPFSAHIDSEGRIFARGSQDMKSVGVQYLAAIRALKRDKITLKRTIHVMFVPDEETGGVMGMKMFVRSKEFNELNIGFSMDEGLASTTDEFSVYYAERSAWSVTFTCNGNAGHGSLLLKNTAGEKLNYILNKMTEFRSEEAEKLENNSVLTVGDVTTVNLTMIEGGVQSNVVPSEMKITFDIRIAIDRSQDQFEAMLNRLCEEAGGGVDLEMHYKQLHVKPTEIDTPNKYWVAFKEAIDDLGLKIKPQICPVGTDSRFLRDVGIPAIGYSPISNTPILLHDHDEFLTADVYLKGIEIYKKIITKVANV